MTQITLDKTSALSVTFLSSCCSDRWTCVFSSSSVQFVYVPRDTTRGLITARSDCNSDRAREEKQRSWFLFTLPALRLFVYCRTKYRCCCCLKFAKKGRKRRGFLQRLGRNKIVNSVKLVFWQGSIQSRINKSHQKIIHFFLELDSFIECR
jgi:hypothetical protein